MHLPHYLLLIFPVQCGLDFLLLLINAFRSIPFHSELPPFSVRKTARKRTPAISHDEPDPLRHACGTGLRNSLRSAAILSGGPQRRDSAVRTAAQHRKRSLRDAPDVMLGRT